MVLNIKLKCFWWVLVPVLYFNSCSIPEPQPIFESESLLTPKGFPKVDFPEDNGFTLARWKLGKKLFYDPVLSADSTISCNSCHKQQFAFADNVALSNGVQGRAGVRNAPSLANVAYHPYYTREGGVPSLEMQVLVPIQEHNEFDFNILLIEERLKKNADYVWLSTEAYGREPDYFVITRALAAFERSLLSGNSPYDQYTFQGMKKALSAKQKKGMDLFFSEKTGCSNCHSGFNFTNYAFENNGLYTTYQDLGRKRLTGADADYALFKVPSLRNVSVSAPYMHDGSLADLYQVVEHYNSGGKDFYNKSSLIKQLGLTEKEKEQLVAFLNALTDVKFLTQNEFENNDE
ncbi:cytochrome-c peroxidase [bacterium]|nr:cytochrome-c peroxidase [bacterium]